MLIFLRNIPPETKKYEIASFINRVIFNCSLSGQVANILTEDIEILLIQYANLNIFETHGLFRISPEQVGKTVIKRLDGTIIKEKHIAVSEYVIRYSSNDLRKKQPSTITCFKEQRASDRRRRIKSAMFRPCELIAGNLGIF
jgi:hypothetical protein